MEEQLKCSCWVLPWTSEFWVSDVRPPNYLCFWKIHCQHWCRLSGHHALLSQLLLRESKMELRIIQSLVIPIQDSLSGSVFSFSGNLATSGRRSMWAEWLGLKHILLTPLWVLTHCVAKEEKRVPVGHGQPRAHWSLLSLAAAES